MPALESKLDPRDATFAANRDAMAALVADLRAKVAAVEQGGGDRCPREARGARQAAAARARPRAGRPGFAVPRVLAARRIRDVRRHDRRRRDHHRYRPRRRPRVRDRLQRRDGQGRHVLPADRQEASARAGDRAREQPAVHLSRRFRRRQPAQPDRRVSRSRSLRPHLLQPGDDVRAGHPAGRRRDGLVHRGRRVRPGDVRRVDHRQGAGDDLPRRAAAREGGDRRDRDGGRAGRRRRPHARVRRRRPFRAGRPPRARHRPPDRRRPEPPQARQRSKSASRSRRGSRPKTSTASSTPTSGSPTTSAK